MFFAQLKSAVRSLRFRLMVWNAVIMFIASLGVLWGLREGVRYTLLSELDDDLQDDFGEISIALVNVFEADNPFFHAGMDRKARGHKQRSWFLQLADMRTPEERQADKARQDQRRREEMARWREEQQRRDESRRSRRARNRPPSESQPTAPPTDSTPATQPPVASPAEASPEAADEPVANSVSPETSPPTSRSADDQLSRAPVAEPVASVALRPASNVKLMSSQTTSDPATDEAGLPGDTIGSTELKETGPRIIWQTFNVPDWTSVEVPGEFDGFRLPDGVPTTVDQFRVMERTVKNARGGPVRVRIGASIRSIQHSADATDRMMLLNILAAIVVAPMGGYWLALRATRPLQAMIRTSDRLRPQQMDERLPISNTEDEIDQLSRAFNRLLDRIAEYLVKRQDLLANSAHELRTPLAALRTSAELALSSVRSPEQYCEVLESIVSECGNLELLVNQLLLLSETESAHYDSRGETVDFSKITNEACDMFGAVAESRDVQLQTDIAEGIIVDGSRLHLRQLLNNLIDNAIKFIPGPGTVTVSLQATGQGQCLIVRDTGVGIAENEQKRLFERFYRGDKSRRRDTPTRGTGLGLSICRAITEAHGGTIAVESQPGVGTSVIVTLPVQTQKLESS